MSRERSDPTTLGRSRGSEAVSTSRPGAWHQDSPERGGAAESRPTFPAVSDRLMTTEEAAEILCVSYSWLKKAAIRGDVPCTRLGRAVRFSRAHLDTIVAAGEQTTMSTQRRGSARTRL